MRAVKRGDIFFAALDIVVGSEQGGTRPVLVVSNDVGNKYSPTIVIVPLTGKVKKMLLPTHVEVPKNSGLHYDSIALVEQIRTIDRARLNEYIGRIEKNIQPDIDAAMAVCVGIEKVFLSTCELMELFLCSRCESDFRNSDYVVVKKVREKNIETCDFCGVGRGFAFGVYPMKD